MIENRKQPWYKDVRFWVLFIVAVLMSYMIGVSSKGIEQTQQSAPYTQEDEPKSPEPIALSGTGQQATSKFTLKYGLATFKIAHDGSDNFSVTLLDGSGAYTSLLVNEIGTFDGSKAIQIGSTGEYLLDVSADGNWSVTIQQ